MRFCRRKDRQCRATRLQRRGSTDLRAVKEDCRLVSRQLRGSQCPPQGRGAYAEADTEQLSRQFPQSGPDFFRIGLYTAPLQRKA